MVVKEMEGRRGRDEEGGREELGFLWGDAVSQTYMTTRCLCCSAALTSFVPSSFPPSLLLSFPFPRRPPLPAVPARTALASLPLARHALFLPLPFHVLLAPALPSCLPPSFDPAGEASRSTSEGVGEEDSFVWERG